MVKDDGEVFLSNNVGGRNMKKDKQYCIGCHDDFYNGNNEMGIPECWGFKSAKVVSRFSIGWWIPQDNKDNFSKVTTHNCHKEPGRYGYYEKIPSHLS